MLRNRANSTACIILRKELLYERSVPSTSMLIFSDVRAKKCQVTTRVAAAEASTVFLSYPRSQHGHPKTTKKISDKFLALPLLSVEER